MLAGKETTLTVSKTCSESSRNTLQSSWINGSVHTPCSENWPFPIGPGEGLKRSLATADEI